MGAGSSGRSSRVPAGHVHTYRPMRQKSAVRQLSIGPSAVRGIIDTQVDGRDVNSPTEGSAARADQLGITPRPTRICI